MKPTLPADKALRRFEWFLPVVFLVLAFSIGTAGILFLRRQQLNIRQTIQNELAAIADLKARQIVNWRNERLDDARFFAKAFFVARDVQAFFSDASSETTRAEILNWLMQLKAGDRYGQVALFDARLNPRLAIPPWTNALSPPMQALMAAALQTNDVVITDLHFGDTTNDIYVDLAFPVFAPRTPSETAPVPLGVIVLRLDPFKFLYPLVQSWPTPSRTAETLLVRREGDQLLFLNELRHRQQTALKLRLSLDSNPQLLAAWAVMGREGVVEGEDYRGVPVLGAIGPIPGTPWFIVAKVDQAEIYAPLRQQALSTGIIILVFLLVVVLSLIRDTTQRKKTDSALQSAKDFAENLIATANTMIVGLDIEGNITLFNQAAEEITGYQRAELAGRNWFEVLVPKDRYPEVWDEFHRLLSGGLPKHFENPILTKAGRERYIVWQNNEIRELGRIVGTISFGMDITGRKEMEDRVHQAELLQKANVELEERVQQRTAELAVANKELESFAFSVSHDLRAPLRGIDGWSLALLEDYGDQLDARAKGYLQTVRSETQRMGQLIDALLELSRVTRQDMQHVTVNLSELAHEIAAELHRAEPGRQVDFCIAPDLVVEGDPILLRAALDNLLGNAWKFTAKRSQARIEFGQTLREGQPVFFIRDNGAGFDMHKASRLFAPFQRLHRKDDFPGTGIGLATVRRILNRHLGRIWAEGEVDQGAVFFFTLGLSTVEKP
jgi:PAS domain S-box-containing protein